MADEQKPSGFGKLLAGIIIGGALGSVIGVAFAPQDGKKTRKVMKEKTEEALKKIAEEYHKQQQKK